MNFQDIIHESYDGGNKALKVNVVAGGVGMATVNINGSATIFAVVNTSAAGDSTNNIGFATVAVSTPTLYAVVNTSAAGVGNSIVTIANTPLETKIIGNVTLDGPLPAGVNSVGFATVNVSNLARTITGNVTLSDSKTYIGLTTATLGTGLSNIGFATVAVSTPTLYAVVNTGAVGITNSIVTVAGGQLYGNVTLDDGSLTGLVAGINSIGFATVQVASVAAGANYIGLASVNVGGTVAVTQSGTWDEVGINDSGNSITVDGTVALGAGVAGVGFATVNVAAIAAGDNNIGNVDIVSGTITAVTDITNPIALKGNVTLSDAKTYVGLVTATLGIGDRFIGLVTATTRNAGTTKTLIPLPVTLGQNSIATVAIPTSAQKINVTNFLLSSNITTEIALKSGVTYLTGNASLGITLFPGGGFELPGSPDSPSWIGLPSGALVVEKRDSGGTTSKIAGHAIYFDE